MKAVRAWFAIGLAVILGVVVCASVAAQSDDTAYVKVLVWQDVTDEEVIYINAQPAVGSSDALDMTPLLLDDGFDPGNFYRYGDIALDVEFGQVGTVRVEIRIWQDVQDGRLLYLSARGAGGSWGTLGTLALPLTDDPRSNGRFRSVAISFHLPLPFVTTLAGSVGNNGYRDGLAKQALFGGYYNDLTLGLTVDQDGSVIVADRENGAIRRIAPDGTVSTIAGGNGLGVRDGPAATAQFAGPVDVAMAPDGSIYVADQFGYRIRKISPDGFVTTVAGGGGIYAPPWGEDAWGGFRDGPAAEARFESPSAIALGPDGNLYIAERFSRIRLLSPDGYVSTYAGTSWPGHLDGPRQEAHFFYLLDLDVDADGNVYVLHAMNDVNASPSVAVRMIETNGMVSTLFASDHPAFGGVLANPNGIAVAADGAIYIANTGRHQILQWTQESGLQAVVGTGEAGAAEGPQKEATFHRPGSIALSSDGDLFVADQSSRVIRKVRTGSQKFDPDLLVVATGEALPRLPGVEVSLFAGKPGNKFADMPRSADGSLAEAEFYAPGGMAIDATGSVLVADTFNHAIRRISTEGTVTTLAGGNGNGVRDGACATAQFAQPHDLAVGNDGVIYVVEAGGNRIRTITRDETRAPACTVTTIAGRGDVESQLGWSLVGGHLDGPGLEARFHNPTAIAISPSGDLYIADTNNSSVRRLSQDGEVTTLARSFSGIRLSGHGIAVDRHGNAFITESGAIVRVDSDGNPEVLVETPHQREGGALSAFLREIALGPDGALYVADGAYSRVVRVTHDGELSIVADLADVAEVDRGGFLTGLVFTPDGDLLASDHGGRNVIWRISFPDEQKTP